MIITKNARVTLSLGKYSQRPHRFVLRVECAQSGTGIIEVELDADQYCAVIAGNSTVEMDAWVTERPDLIGATKEVMREEIKVDKREPRYLHNENGGKRWRAWARRQIPEALLAEGWEPHLPDLANHHRWVAERTYEVSFWRYVKDGKVVR